MNTTARYASYVEAMEARTTGLLDDWTISYVTKGGTWIIASSGPGNDDGRPHDLLAVLPLVLEGSRVVPLRPTVHPDLVAALRSALGE